MMEKIFSKLQPEKLLHFVVRKEDFAPGRQDLIEPDNFLQCSMLNLAKGTTFRPHKHKFNHRDEAVIAQESWVIIKGCVTCYFYDIDDTLICTKHLIAGDASFTLFGGHNYRIEEDDTKVLEYKTGKYFGQQQDKVFI